MIQQKQEDEAVLKSSGISALQSSHSTQNEKNASSIRQQEIDQSNRSSVPTSTDKVTSSIYQQEIEQSNQSLCRPVSISSIHQQDPSARKLSSPISRLC